MKKDFKYTIICQPRSGSTLLRRILNSHSKIYSPTEPWVYYWFWENLNSENFSTEAFNKFLGDNREKILEKMFNTIIKEKLEEQNKKKFIEKTPLNIEILPFINNFFNPKQYIFLIRDGRGIVASALYRGGTLKSVIKKRVFLHYFSHLFEYKRRQEAMLSFINNIDFESAFLLRYQDLVSKPKVVIKNLCSFLGEEFEPGMLEYKEEEEILGDKKSESYDGIQKKSVEKWRNRLFFLEKKIFQLNCEELNSRSLSLPTSY